MADHKRNSRKDKTGTSGDKLNVSHGSQNGKKTAPKLDASWSSSTSTSLSRPKPASPPTRKSFERRNRLSSVQPLKSNMPTVEEKNETPALPAPSDLEPDSLPVLRAASSHAGLSQGGSTAKSSSSRTSRIPTLTVSRDSMHDLKPRETSKTNVTIPTASATAGPKVTTSRRKSTSNDASISSNTTSQKGLTSFGSKERSGKMEPTKGIRSRSSTPETSRSTVRTSHSRCADGNLTSTAQQAPRRRDSYSSGKESPSPTRKSSLASSSPSRKSSSRVAKMALSSDTKPSLIDKPREKDKSPPRTVRIDKSSTSKSTSKMSDKKQESSTTAVESKQKGQYKTATHGTQSPKKFNETASSTDGTVVLLEVDNRPVIPITASANVGTDEGKWEDKMCATTSSLRGELPNIRLTDKQSLPSASVKDAPPTMQNVSLSQSFLEMRRTADDTFYDESMKPPTQISGSHKKATDNENYPYRPKSQPDILEPLHLPEGIKSMPPSSTRPVYSPLKPERSPMRSPVHMTTPGVQDEGQPINTMHDVGVGRKMAPSPFKPIISPIKDGEKITLDSVNVHVNKDIRPPSPIKTGADRFGDASPNDWIPENFPPRKSPVEKARRSKSPLQEKGTRTKSPVHERAWREKAPTPEQRLEGLSSEKVHTEKYYPREKLAEKYHPRESPPEKYYPRESPREKNYPGETPREKHYPRENPPENPPENHYPRESPPEKHYPRESPPEKHYQRESPPEKHYPRESPPEKYYPRETPPEKHYPRESPPEKHYSQETPPEKYHQQESPQGEYSPRDRPLETYYLRESAPEKYYPREPYPHGDSSTAFDDSATQEMSSLQTLSIEKHPYQFPIELPPREARHRNSEKAHESKSREHKSDKQAVAFHAQIPSDLQDKGARIVRVKDFGTQTRELKWAVSESSLLGAPSSSIKTEEPAKSMVEMPPRSVDTLQRSAVDSTLDTQNLQIESKLSAAVGLEKVDVALALERGLLHLLTRVHELVEGYIQEQLSAATLPNTASNISKQPMMPIINTTSAATQATSALPSGSSAPSSFMITTPMTPPPKTPPPTNTLADIAKAANDAATKLANLMLAAAGLGPEVDRPKQPRPKSPKTCSLPNSQSVNIGDSDKNKKKEGENPTSTPWEEATEASRINDHYVVQDSPSSPQKESPNKKEPNKKDPPKKPGTSNRFKAGLNLNYSHYAPKGCCHCQCCHAPKNENASYFDRSDDESIHSNEVIQPEIQSVVSMNSDESGVERYVVPTNDVHRNKIGIMYHSDILPLYELPSGSSRYCSTPLGRYFLERESFMALPNVTVNSRTVSPLDKNLTAWGSDNRNQSPSEFVGTTSNSDKTSTQYRERESFEVLSDHSINLKTASSLDKNLTEFGTNVSPSELECNVTNTDKPPVQYLERGTFMKLPNNIVNYTKLPSLSKNLTEWGQDFVHRTLSKFESTTPNSDKTSVHFPSSAVRKAPFLALAKSVSKDSDTSQDAIDPIERFIHREEVMKPPSPTSMLLQYYTDEARMALPPVTIQSDELMLMPYSEERRGCDRKDNCTMTNRRLESGKQAFEKRVVSNNAPENAVNEKEPLTPTTSIDEPKTVANNKGEPMTPVDAGDVEKISRTAVNQALYEIYQTEKDYTENWPLSHVNIDLLTSLQSFGVSSRGDIQMDAELKIKNRGSEDSLRDQESSQSRQNLRSIELSPSMASLFNKHNFRANGPLIIVTSDALEGGATELATSTESMTESDRVILDEESSATDEETFKEYEKDVAHACSRTNEDSRGTLLCLKSINGTANETVSDQAPNETKGMALILPTDDTDMVDYIDYVLEIANVVLTESQLSAIRRQSQSIRLMNLWNDFQLGSIPEESSDEDLEETFLAALSEKLASDDDELCSTHAPPCSVIVNRPEHTKFAESELFNTLDLSSQELMEDGAIFHQQLRLELAAETEKIKSSTGSE